LSQVLNGKTIVSADHGENLGEKRHGRVFRGHGNETKECRLVPWLEMPYTTRREVTENAPVNSGSIERDLVNKRLEDLGYV
jgi:hypothetical protein